MDYLDEYSHSVKKSSDKALLNLLTNKFMEILDQQLNYHPPNSSFEMEDNKENYYRLVKILKNHYYYIYVFKRKRYLIKSL